ncbi:MAG TPA: hypothetical protein ENN67_07615 [Firmicutes bacterium]|nr:hypothetical protein [Bacillota bacterium]
MRSPVRLKIAEAIRTDLTEFAERWVRYVRTNELVPDTDEPFEEDVNRARLGFEVLANLLEGSDYDKYENVIRRLLHDWINLAGQFSDLIELEPAFPAFLIPHLTLSEEGEEYDDIRNVLEEFFDSDIRAQFLSDYLSVYEDIIGDESRHTAYVIEHFDSILALSAHLNGAETRDEILEGLPDSFKDLFENVLGIMLWSETANGLILKSVEILDEDVPPVVVDMETAGIVEESFETGEVRLIRESSIPASMKSILNVEPSLTISAVAVPIQPRESPGLLIMVLSGNESPGGIELSLCRVAASETALALDRASGQSRIVNVNRRIRDILLLSRETSWGSGFRETAELVVDYLADISGARRILLLTASTTGNNDLTIRSWREIPDDILENYRNSKKLHGLLAVAIKSRKVILLSKDRLESVLCGKEAPQGFLPSDGEALGIMPLDRKGVVQGICIFLCPANFANESESLDILAVFAGIAADNLATAREYERSMAYASIAEADAKRAKILQEHLTPRFKRSGEIVFWSSLQAAGELAGDVTVVHVPESGRLSAWTADVAGRGSSAAWSMMFIRQLLTEIPHELNRPSDVLNYINHELHEIETVHNAGDLFITSMGLCIDSISNKAIFARAGTPRIFKIDQDSSTSALNPDGIPLGIFADTGIEEIEFTFEPGCKLVWVSDGFLTARNESGEIYSEDRLHDCLSKYGFLPARALYERILQSTIDFGIEEKAIDDRSLILIGICGKPDWTAENKGSERDRLLDKSLEYLTCFKMSNADFTALRILLDEAIKNANEHGNRGNPDGRIEVRITSDPRYVHISVRDEGGKLDEKATSPLLRAEKILEDKGRGFLLMRHHASYLWVENDRGEINAVRMLEEVK